MWDLIDPPAAFFVFIHGLDTCDANHIGSSANVGQMLKQQMKYWLVGLSEPRMELAASKALALSGYNCFQPIYRERVIDGGRTKWRDRLLLGRYLLIEFVFDFADHYGPLVSTKGLSSLLMADERPLAVRDREVKILRDLVNDKGHVPVKVTANRFTKGDRVYTIKGSFGEITGTYDGVKNGTKVNVLYELFGQLVTVEVEQRSLIAA